MNLNELLELAKKYHPSAKITRLTKIGHRIVFYGGFGDSSQFAIDLDIESPNFEKIHMVVDIRSNFIAEVGNGEIYNRNFPLVATMNLNGEQYQTPISSLSNFEKWIEETCPHYNFFKKLQKWSVLQMYENTPKQYKGKEIVAIFLTRTAYDI